MIQGKEEERNSHKSAPMTLFVLKATAIASLGGIIFGYDVGVISSALPQISKDLLLSENQQELVVGILYLGAGMGASIGGVLCDTMGRKTSIMITDMMFVVGALILFFAKEYSQLLVGRVIVGFGIAVSGIADVAYLHEIAPPDWRGAIVSVNESCISLGFLLSFACGVFWEDIEGGWRNMLGTSGWLAAVQFIGMISMPESPIWLKKKVREEDQVTALQRKHRGDQKFKGDGRIAGVPTTNDLLEVREGNMYDKDLLPGAVAQNHVEQHLSEENNGSFLNFVKRYHFQCWIVLFLSISSHLSGQLSVLNYAPHIISNLGYDGLSMTLWIGVVKFIVTSLVIGTIEYAGRRFLLLFGMLTIVISQFMLAFSLSISNNDLGTNGRQLNAICGFISILGVVIGYSASFGPLGWLLTSELFPSDIRGRALGISTVIIYICASLVTSSFLSMEMLFGPSVVFLSYALVTLVATIFANIAIPDTGRKSAEEIDELLNAMWFWRLFKSEELLSNVPHRQDTTALDSHVETSDASSGVYQAF
mmetsp:Transcript_27766/g.42018  ORF Transcript_27766/g.42018 Transcript_27766/m.42018 type:complete len:535 (-) Transcript_27766:32-1636(-)